MVRPGLLLGDVSLNHPESQAFSASNPRETLNQSSEKLLQGLLLVAVVGLGLRALLAAVLAAWLCIVWKETLEAFASEVETCLFRRGLYGCIVTKLQKLSLCVVSLTSPQYSWLKLKRQVNAPAFSMAFYPCSSCVKWCQPHFPFLADAKPPLRLANIVLPVRSKARALKWCHCSSSARSSSM